MGGTGWGGAEIRMAALEQLPAIVWVFTGPDHVAMLANRAGREYRGGSRAYLLGRSLRESVLPENRQVVDLLDDVYRTGTTRAFYETKIRVDEEQRYVTFTATPLRDEGGEVVGVITYMTDVTESVLAKRTAAREHATLQVLQERLLPPGLPVLPDLRVAARYRTAERELVAGGDWYDAIVLAPGKIGASVGDVVGHGPDAAAVMGQLRAVLNAALLDTCDPVAALAQLQRFVPMVPGARGSTACALTVDAGTGEVSYACAGHPPPVLVRADGAATFLDAPPTAPLGLGLLGPAAAAGGLLLGQGESVLLYSDGAVERPGVPTENGRDRLLAACTRAADGGAGATGFVDAVLAEVAPDAPADDLALLAVCRLTAPVAPLLAGGPATPEHLAVLRRQLRGWLATAEVCDDDAIAVQIACGEATANTVEHAYREPGAAPGTVLVCAELTGESTVAVRVEDGGRWREPGIDPGDRGRGMLLMRECMDDVRVHQHDGGTVVEMSRRVQAARAVPPAAPAPGAGTVSSLHIRLETDSGAVTGAVGVVAGTADSQAGAVGSGAGAVGSGTGAVGSGAGPVAGGGGPGVTTVAARAVLTGDRDAAGLPAAARARRRATRGGVLPLDLDLTGVDHLASAGVRLLFDLAAELAATGRPLSVRVAPGSAAEHVLELTGFPHVTRAEVALPAS